MRLFQINTGDVVAIEQFNLLVILEFDYYYNYTDSYTIHSQLQHSYKYSLISNGVEQYVRQRKLM